MKITIEETAVAHCVICGYWAHYAFSGRDVLKNDYKRYDYLLCGNCGTYFLHPMPDALAVASFYPEEYVETDVPYSRKKRNSLLRVAELKLHHQYSHLKPSIFCMAAVRLLSAFYRKWAINYVSNGALLDIGCGNGRFLKSMRELGWQVQGVEFNKKSVEQCRNDFLTVHHGDLSSAEFAQASFDVITLRHVIEHIPTPNELMAELARILKPGGRLIIETPNFASVGWSWFSTKWYAAGIPYHLMLFSPKSLQLLAEKHGFVQEDYFLETTPKFFLNSVDIIMENKGVPSKKIRWRRLLARFYVWYAQKTGRGDVIHSTFVRPRTKPLAR